MKVADKFSWCDPYSDNYRPEIVQLIENVANSKASLSKSVWQIEVDKEDIISELYLYLFSDPHILSNGKIPSKILHSRAANFCFKQRADQGAAIIGTDILHNILTDFNNIPSYIHKVLYGPVFTKAGQPDGSYLRAIEQEYKYKNTIVGSSKRKTLTRAVVRLAEVINGIMVGTPDTIDSLMTTPYTPTIQEPETEDKTFKSFDGLYMCNQGHKYRISTGAKPDNKKIGKREHLGYYTCRCGNVLELDTRI